MSTPIPKKVLIFGDAMIDQTTYAIIERTAPEAPIPIWKEVNTKQTLGGAANVASNLSRIGFDVHLVCLGDSRLSSILPTTFHTTVLPYHTSTIKHRILVDQTIVGRIDYEETEPIVWTTELSSTIKSILSSSSWIPDAIVFSDYQKGFLTREVVSYILSWSSIHSVPSFVDPKTDWEKYRGCTVLKPNRKEWELVLHQSFLPDSCPSDYIDRIHHSSQTYISSGSSSPEWMVTTLSEHGLIFYSKEYSAWVRTRILSPCVDVTGAGDIVLCCLVYGYVYHLNPIFVAHWCEWIARKSVQYIGTYQMTSSDLPSSLSSSSVSPSSLLSQPHQPPPRVLYHQDWKSFSFPSHSIATNGCFDWFHPGHDYLLTKCHEIATEFHSCLIVVINSDTSVRRLKGPSRPIWPLQKRIYSLLRFPIAYIIVFDDITPKQVYRKLQPTLIIKGDDYELTNVSGMTSSDGVVLIRRYGNWSTTLQEQQQKQSFS